ncbi:MAG: bifunctional MaoC family dehydratase N-terminal/OB-fold nucleic acid binding domain-containing protein [Actinophytocola sp.]|uniref:bifunctional MaoC family dehydratase N-terminal/OB-fold nucleic acid binding domain-containing protein n=1 Tax=Actinophytocola sp. TaxID=1872138 RepID=UPI003D6A1014
MTEPISEAARAVAARGESARRAGRDPVNLPMIRNWVEAIGDRNPVYTDPGYSSVHDGLVAPPAMAQVWTMPGLYGDRGSDDPLGAMVSVLDEAGFTSVVATNSEQTYHRYLRPGETVEVTSSLESVTGPKRTSLGEGWFVTTRSTWYVGDEPVASMLFRILKFRPAAGAAPDVIRPSVNRDTEFFWAGTARGELRIQRCGGCGELRHPPGPMCPACGETKPEFVVASGRGSVYSYVVHHHPPVPGRSLPFVVALVELEEGVRMLAELVDVAPSSVRVGLPVVAGFVRVDDSLTMPVWRAR